MPVVSSGLAGSVFLRIHMAISSRFVGAALLFLQCVEPQHSFFARCHVCSGMVFRQIFDTEHIAYVTFLERAVAVASLGFMTPLKLAPPSVTCHQQLPKFQRKRSSGKSFDKQFCLPTQYAQNKGCDGVFLFSYSICDSALFHVKNRMPWSWR